MKSFDDMLPEEKEPQYVDLIALLQRAYSRTVPLPSAEQAQIITRVRERLVKADHGDSFNGDIPIPQIGVLDSSPHQAVSLARMPQRDRRRFRLIALLTAALVIAVLLGAPLLLLRHSSTGGTGGLPTLTLSSTAASPGNTGGFPTLTLSSNAASPGSSVNFTLKHFSPSTIVVLTHDIQDPISINGSTSITTDAQGMASFSLVIDTSWKPGFHLIVAEDASTSVTASANLQITGERPSSPPRLLITTTPITMDADVVGANTIRLFTLGNGGGGSITWSASSNQPWLLVAPSQGMFSQTQSISLAVQRVGLKPGDYSGSITISSNVSTPQHIEVDMTVRPLPPNAGPVLAIAPALLSFTKADGDPYPSQQSLTISNPGSSTLNWSLTPAPGLTCNWLSATPTIGSVLPGGSMTLMVTVQSQCLLPGAYTGTLKFTAPGAVDSSQAVNVSLTVQPHCGLVTSTGYLAFTVVAGQNNLANQTLSLNATASCAGTPLLWTSASTASWLAITPASGQLKGTASAVVSVSVNAVGLSPKVYYGDLSFVVGQNTLTVMVQLTVQAAPPSAPIMGASPLSLNFSTIQGQPSPTGQVVTITNNGSSVLNWMASPMQLALPWLGASPSGGTIAPGQTGQVTIKVNTAPLTPGNYVGQVTLNGMDEKGNSAPGSPQTILVDLVVQPPCSISPPSSSALSFSAVAGAASHPPSQTVLFTGIGSCTWPVAWTTSVAPTAPWLSLTASSGMVNGTGQSGNIGVITNITGLQPGTYSTQVTISASDASGGTVQGSPQSFSVTLTVTGFTVSGSVMACPGSTPPTCVTPQPLAGATVTLMNGSTTVATTTTDASGNYSFSNIPLGTYTINVAGFDASNTHYVGSLHLTLTANALNTTIQAFPG